MRSKFLPLTAAVFGALGSGGALAQDDVTVLERLVIVGKSDRLCIPAGSRREADDARPYCAGEGISRGNVPGDTFDRNQLDRLPSGSNAQDFVKRLPGVVTGGAPGEDKDARVLGMDKEYTRTSIDGVVLPDGGEKREFNLDRIPAALVDSVEVVRGRRADMEADGIAGQIEVKLKEIPQVPEWQLQSAIGGSSDGLFLYDASVAGGGMYSQGFGAQGGLTSARNSNSKLKSKFGSNGLLSETEDETKRIDTYGALGDVLWQNDANAFHLKPLFLELDETKDKYKGKYKADGTLSGAETEVEDKTKKTYGATASWRHDFDDLNGATLEVKTGHYRTTEIKDKTKHVLNGAGVEDLGKIETETEDKLDRITFGQVDFLLPTEIGGLQNNWKTGVMLRGRDRTKDKTKTKAGVVQANEPKDIYGIEELVWGAYVLDEIDFSNGLIITPGVRFEGSTLESSVADGTTGSGETFDILPSLPVHYQMTDTWSIDASVARLVNRPKFDMIIPQNSDSLLGNPDLDPEHAWAFDASATYETDDLQLSFGVFHRSIEDLLETVDTGLINGDGDSVYQYQNVGDGWTNGIILSQRVSLAALDMPVLNGFSLYSTQTFARSEVTTSDGVKRAFKEQPRFFADIALEWTDPSERLVASAGLGYTAKVTTAGDDGNESRDAELGLDLALNYKLTDSYELYGLAKNVTGTDRVKRKTDGTVEIEEGVKSYFAGIRAKF